MDSTFENTHEYPRKMEQSFVEKHTFSLNLIKLRAFACSIHTISFHSKAQCGNPISILLVHITDISFEVFETNSSVTFIKIFL